MSLDHEAIRSAYPEAVVIDDGTGAFDKDGNKISLDSAKVTAARQAIDNAYAAVEYQRKRKEFHPDTLLSKGLPNELLEKAKEKFIEIQAAYEEIEKKNKLK